MKKPSKEDKAPDARELLADLTRAKVAFQLRAIKAVMGVPE